MFTGAPIHILTGDLDDWVPAAACTTLVSDLRRNGMRSSGGRSDGGSDSMGPGLQPGEVAVPASIIVYPDAHHGFDRDPERFPLETERSGYKLGSCGTFRMRKDGALMMKVLNHIRIPSTSGCAGTACAAGPVPALCAAAAGCLLLLPLPSRLLIPEVILCSAVDALSTIRYSRCSHG